MRSYPKYKSSGIEWIGKIPETWNATLLKRALKDIKDGTHGSFKREDEGKPLLSAKNVQSDKIDISEAESLISEDDYNSIVRNGYPKKNDLLLTIVGTIGRAYVYDLDYPLAFQRSVAFLRFKKDHVIEFYYYQVQSSLFLSQLFSLAKTSAQSGVYLSDIKSSISLIPPVSEQQQIVDFLDCKTRQCDRFISNRQKQIELLNEQKATIINKAVTKGINPNAKMKHSGIDWIGDIPEYWEIWKVSRLFKIIGSGTTPKAGTPEYYENGTIPWINTGDLNDGVLESCENRITEKAFELHSTLKMYGKGTLLIAMYGATIAKLSILNFDACTNQACCALSDSQLIKIDFAFNWFLSQKQNIINLSYGGGQPNISQDLVKSIKIPLPPKEEQTLINNFINIETSKIEALISKYQKQIELMQEYRTALISQAVTGKIDVRDWKPPTK